MSYQDDKYKLQPTPELAGELDEDRQLRHHARNFLLAGGLLAGHSDGDLSVEEQDRFVEALTEYFDDPDDVVERIDSPDVAIELLKSSMMWLERSGGDHRLELYRHLAEIVAADGALDPMELRYMQNVAKGLGIPQAEAKAVIQAEFTDRAE